MESSNNNTTIIVIVLILIAAAIGAWFVLSGPEESAENALRENGESMEKDVMVVDEGAMMEETNDSGAMMEAEGAMMEESDTDTTGGAMMEAVDSMMAAGSYEAYSPAKLALANQGDVVLFFHASWCPTCRAADKSITSTGVPDGLTILKLDYDTATELRKKYGVTTQHTFVQVDANGNLINKWTGSVSAAAIAAATI